MNIHIINNPKEKDFEDIIKLLNKIFAKFDTNPTKYTSIMAYEKTKDSKNTAIFEARDEDDLIGFAIGYERYPGYYHIWELGVEENYRGKGIASQMYDEIEKFARKRKFRGLTLNTFNRFKSNIRLVIKKGYKIYDLDKKDKNDPKIMFKLDF